MLNMSSAMVRRLGGIRGAIVLRVASRPSRCSSSAISSGRNPNIRAQAANQQQGKGARRRDDEDALDLDMLLADKEQLQGVRDNLLKGMAAQSNTRSSSAGGAAADAGVASAKTGNQGHSQQRNSSSSTNTNTSQRVAGRDAPPRAARERSSEAGSAEGRRDRPSSRPAAGRGRPERDSSRSGQSRQDSRFVFPEGVEAPVAVLQPGKDWLFRNGSPMVYGGAVNQVLAPGGRKAAEPAAGDPVMVTDSSGICIGWGVYNPVSMFRVRLMQMRSEYEADGACLLDMPALIRKRIRQACSLRKRLGLPNPDTNMYRLVNSEGDRLSGLVVDVLSSVAVVQSVAAWAERYRPDIEAAIRNETGLSKVIWKPSAEILKEEGVSIPARSEGDASGGSEDASSLGETYVAHEAGLKFLTAPMGQKTGFYADQRDSRSFLAPLCKGARVLDLCCYSGAFALAAARAGADSVKGVDSSAPAISLAAENAKLNGLQDKVEFVRGDISAVMKAELQAGNTFDVLVLDPPKLAPNRASLARATTKYQALNSLALKLVAPGGVFMTCSCSGAMTQGGDFPQVVAEAARSVGRNLTLLRHAGAAPDHPLHPAYPEGEYLTNLTYLVD